MLLSEVLEHTISNRLDAEFFKKEYLLQDTSISKFGFWKLSEVTKKIDVGFVGAMVANYRDEGIALLQTKNINAFFVSDTDTIKITKEFHSQLKKSQVYKEDILIARSGSFGKASIYLKNDVINSSDIIIIQAKEDLVNPYFLTAFLNSKFGVSQMIRFASGGLQGHVNLTILEELEIPKISVNLQVSIEILIKSAFEKLEQSKTTYTTAENILLSEIGLTDFTPSNDPVNIKTFSESFATSGRLDAEYYSMQSESVIRAITQCKYGAVPLHKVCKTQRGNLIPDTYYCDTGTKYIRGADFSANHLTDTGVSIHSSFQKRNEILTERGDIVFALIGSVGKLALVTEGFVGSFISNNIGLMRLVCKNFLPEYVHLFLTSTLGKILFDKVEMRTAQPKISDKDIWDFPIPDLDIRHQQNIAALITQSFTLKKQSEHLLDVAKRAVEIAIEQDEAAAMAWIAAHG